MAVSAHIINRLIDIAARRLDGSVPDIADKAEQLKSAAIVAAEILDDGDSFMSPVFEALITNASLARSLGITISWAPESARDTLSRKVITRCKDKTDRPSFAVHMSGDDVYFLEFPDGPNLVRETINLHMQRVQRNERGRA